MEHDLFEAELPQRQEITVDDLAIEDLADTTGAGGNCFGTAGTATCPSTAGTWGTFT